jgi:DNA-binding XRE family transcriptional regulator
MDILTILRLTTVAGRHKRLTSELRRLRAESGLTRDDVAGWLDWHPTKITRIETGQWTRLNLRDVRDLLDIYGLASTCYGSLAL